MSAFFRSRISFIFPDGDSLGAVMMLTGQEEILFLPPHDARGEIFTGRKLGPEDAERQGRHRVR